MKCPICNGHTKQLETRTRPAGVFRRYECGKDHRFTTQDHLVVRVDTKKPPAGRPKEAHA